MFAEPTAPLTLTLRGNVVSKGEGGFASHVMDESESQVTEAHKLDPAETTGVES